jgi:serine/threonine-protein kinase RsbT
MVRKRDMNFEFRLEGGDFMKAGFASTEVKKILKQLNLDPVLIRKVAIAAYEAEVNVVAHAWRGIMKITINPEAVVIRIEDEGPGIPDIEKAMQEGFSTASAKVREMGFGAGMGLSNMKRNSDKLTITSEVGKGTVVEINHYIGHEEKK